MRLIFSFQLQWSLQTLCFVFCFFKAGMTVGFSPSFNSLTGAYLQDKNYTYIILCILFTYIIYIHIFTCCHFFQVLTSLQFLPDVGHSPAHVGSCFLRNFQESWSIFELHLWCDYRELGFAHKHWVQGAAGNRLMMIWSGAVIIKI